MYATLFVYGAPTFGSAVTVQLAAGKIACLVGRNANTSWIQLVLPPELGGSALGWSPASAFQVNVPLTVLPVTDGSGTPPVVTPPPATSGTYVVQAGDTMFSISQRYAITLTALIQANNVYAPYIIYVGQVLVIPGTEQRRNFPPPDIPSTWSSRVIYLVSIAPDGLSWWTLATVNGVGYPYSHLPRPNAADPGQLKTFHHRGHENTEEEPEKNSFFLCFSSPWTRCFSLVPYRYFGRTPRSAPSRPQVGRIDVVSTAFVPVELERLVCARVSTSLRSIE